MRDTSQIRLPETKVRIFKTGEAKVNQVAWKIDEYERLEYVRLRTEVVGGILHWEGTTPTGRLDGGVAAGAFMVLYTERKSCQERLRDPEPSSGG